MQQEMRKENAGEDLWGRIRNSQEENLEKQ